MRDPVQVGVVGTGRMGSQHSLNIAGAVAGASLAAVMDVDTDRCEPISDATGAVVFEDAEALIASDEVDAVLIASPDDTHAGLALSCLEAGKPALVEKPLATELADAAAVVGREIAGPRRLLQVGFVRHYDADHLAVYRAVQQGAVGRPLLFRGWHRNPPEATAASSREVLVNAGIHDLDSARWFLGQEIAEISVAGTVIHPEKTDQLHLQIVTLVMDGGGLGVIEVNKDSGFGYEVGVEITGSTGVVSSPPHRTPAVRNAGTVGQAVDLDWQERFADAYLAEVRAWIRSVIDAKTGGPSAWDGYRSLAAAIAGAESLERRAPLTLDAEERPGLYGS